jgi:hypothetical protein
MLDWWFTFFETTQHIRWWHPTIMSSTGAGIITGKRGALRGSQQKAVEWLAELPPVAARLKFHGAEEVFARQSLQEARETQASAAICARIGFGDEVALDDRGRRWMARCCTWRAIPLWLCAAQPLPAGQGLRQSV